MKLRFLVRIVVAAFALLVIALLVLGRVARAQNAIPYSRVPGPGDSVRLDGSLGGAKTAWAYFDKHWLEEYLKATIDAAAANKEYAQMSDSLSRVAGHVTEVANGTKASVETVEPFTYNGRTDIEVRVLVGEGTQKGRELWTTCAELVDSAGHRYVRL